MHSGRTTHTHTLSFSVIGAVHAQTVDVRPISLYLSHVSHMCSVSQGFFDEDSMEEFIASETEESSMSLTSEDEKSKK